jgi:hypothetical protein
MNLTELKSGLHYFIDQINSTELLGEYYNEMNNLVEATNSSIWGTLSDKQKKEVLLSFEESEDENNLIDNDEVMVKYKKWL